MANLPVLQSKEQILGGLITGFLARVKSVNDITRASIINQFFSAIAQSNFKAAADIISMIDALSVDRSTGEALQRLARDGNVVISPGTFSTGKVTITDTSFVKVFSNIFAGQPAPVAGSTKIYVVNGNNWNQTGKLYIGRDTPNVEGPLNFVSVQSEANGAYWSINLDPGTPTTKFHNLGEEIVQAQGGNRVLNQGTIVHTPSGSAVTSVDFGTVSTVIIPDGEVTYTDIPIVCRTLGSKGNVPRGAISQANGLSFTATVFNNNAIVNGLPPDDDDSLRKKIKEAELKKSKGTEAAIKLAAIGVISSDDQKQVVSSNVVRYSDSSAALIFDDGNGYEPTFNGVGIEQVIDIAIGGEEEVQLRKRPVTPALVKTISEGPFSVPDQYGLEVVINGISKTHFFPSTDFKVPANQQSFEIVSSINGDPNIHFLASTSEGGTKIVIYPKDRNSNDIKVNRRSSNDANNYMNFPITIQYALLLYKDDEILYEDGKFATVSTRLKSTWHTSISAGDTLSYKIDQTPEITIVFTTDEFQKVDISAIVSSFTDIDIWVEVMNRLMTGVIVSKNGEVIDFTSARGENDRAEIEITGGTLKAKIFTPSSAQLADGRESDYTLNKQTGQVGFKVPLLPGQNISAGSQFTHAKVITTQIPDGPTAAGKVWMIVDGDCVKVETGLQANTNTTITKSLTKIRIKVKTQGGDPVAFDSVLPGDWVLVWGENTDVVDYPSMWAAQGFWRVETVKRGEITVDDGVTPRSITGITEALPTDRIVIVRSAAPMQKLGFSLGTISIFINEILDQISGVVAEVVGSTVRISTMTAGSNGQLLMVAANSQGKALGITIGTIYNNIPSHRAFVVTEDSEAGMPSFSYTTIEKENSDIEYVSSLYEEIGGTRDDFIEILPNYKTPSAPYQDLVNLPDTNQRRRIFVRNYNPDASFKAITVVPKPCNFDDSAPLQAGDRYFLRTSFQFDADDTVTAVIDGDSVTKGFGLRVARQLIVNAHSTPSMSDFSADDGESSLPLNDSSSFLGFDFENFKVWRKASVILTDGTYAMRAQSGSFGPSGNRTRIGFVYPKSNAQTTTGINLQNSETIDIGIILPVMTPRTPNWDGTTSFTMDVISVSPGKDSIKYTWRAGTEPNFLAGGGGADVNVGDIAMIDGATDFLAADKDIQARVTNVNATDFTVEFPSGKVVSDNVEFSSLENKNKLVTVTTDGPHGILPGDRVGVWDTEKVDGFNAPLDGSYYATVTGPTSFTFQATNSVPGRAFSSPSGAGHSANLVTVNANAHGLFVGNVILVSDVNTGSYDGKAVVRKVNSPNQFAYIRQGASVGVSAGRFDYQSYDPDYNGTIVSLSKVGDTVTATTTAAHGMTDGDFVDIFGTSIDSWGGVDEIQTLTNTVVPTAGSFQLRYTAPGPINYDTSALPYNATSLQVQNAINALALFSTVQVTGSFPGGGFVINYVGADGNTNQIQPTVTSNTLVGSGVDEIQAYSFGPVDIYLTWSSTTSYAANVIVLLNGVAYISQSSGNLNHNPESSPTYWDVMIALAGTGQYQLQYGLGIADVTGLLAYNATAGQVQTALEALPSIGPGNVSVTGSYTSYFRVTFIGALAKTDVDQITIYSQSIYSNEIATLHSLVEPTWDPTLPELNDDTSTSYQKGDVVLYDPITAPWSGLTTYSIGDDVVYSNVIYHSIVSSNTNHTPSTSPLWWSVGAGTGSRYYLAKQDIVGHINPNTDTAQWQSSVLPVLGGVYAIVSVGDKIITASGPGIGTVYAVISKISHIEGKPYVLELSAIYSYDPSNSFTVRKDIMVRSGTQRLGVANGAVTVTPTTVQGGGSLSTYGLDDIVQYGGLNYKSKKANKNITTITAISGILAEVTTMTAHGLVATNTVKIVGNNVSVYNNTFTVTATPTTTTFRFAVTTAGTGTGGEVGTNVSQPDITPSEWNTTTEDLSGRFVISIPALNPTTSFQYILEKPSGVYSEAHSTSASFTKLKQSGKLARSIAATTLLQFGLVGATTQQIVDTLTQTYPDLITASVEPPTTGTETVDTSTEDQDAGTGYLTGIIYSIETRKGSRLVKVEVDQNVPAGATVTLSMASNPEYNGTFTVLAQEQVGARWKLTIQSAIFSASTSAYSVAGGSFTGSSPYRILLDGENSVLMTDLNALVGSPTFTVKRPWVLAPYIGEELRILTTNTDQLTRFWNKLVVTGLANVSDVQNSEYGRQLQITTNTFGADGSVQVVGGIANNKQVALIGSGTELSNVGTVTIPFELRKGINERSWLRVEQTVRNNKIIGLQTGTYIQTTADGIQIISGPGSFQTKRISTQDETSQFKVEKHGDFIAVINIGGQALGLTSAGVIEGDWVRFKNTIELAYDPNGNYVAGDRVLSQGLNFTAIASNGIGTTVVAPTPLDKWDIDTEYALDDTVNFNNKAYRNTAVTPNIGQYPNNPTSDWELTWEVREWNGGNTGIFQVVRVFGDDSFWIENANAVEELLTLGNDGNLSFYSFDSVMPGDTLVVSSSILGDSNIDRFTVRDETFDPTYSFPTSSRIWTDIMVAHATTNLGDAYVQVNIEEANPVRLWKRVFSVGPGASNLATIVFDSPELLNRISSSNAAFIVSQGKLNYDTVPAFGIDAYKYYTGLIAELNKVIYGDPTDPINFEGIRAAGTDIDIKAAIVRRIVLAISIRVRTGIPFSEVREAVKAAAAGYVNNLDTGEQVSLSKVVEAVSKVNGVVSVVITFPTYNSVEDQIAISPQEKALIQDPTVDVTVSIIGT